MIAGVKYEYKKVRLSGKDFEVDGNLEAGEYGLVDYIFNNRLLPLELYWHICGEIETAYEG